MAGVDFSRIRTNIGALQALNSLNTINQKLAIHQTRLATGKRINSASDDAAGFTIATKLGVRASGLGTALNKVSINGHGGYYYYYHYYYDDEGERHRRRSERRRDRGRLRQVMDSVWAGVRSLL